MMRLIWRMPAPALTLQWRGPDARTIAAAATNRQIPLAAIIGPPGSIGPQGATGPVGPAYDLAAAVIDGGTFN